MSFVLAFKIQKTTQRTKELRGEKRDEVNGGMDMMCPQLSLGKQEDASKQED